MKIVQLITEIPRFIASGFAGALRQNRSMLASALRQKLYGTACYLETQVVISNPGNFRAGPRSALYHGCYILNPHGTFRLGSDSHLGAFCFANACYGSIAIGDNVAIGPGSRLFSYSNHYRAGSLVTDQKITSDVVIGNNVFIGANCVILPGSLIGDNVVVGAGSVIKGELAGNCVYAGTPCRIIKSGWYSSGLASEDPLAVDSGMASS
jgi:galactoside O-acetyltransferase